jgi:hypothetical protein
VSEEPLVGFEEFYVWASQAFPLLYCSFGGYIYTRVVPGLPTPPTLRFTHPRLRQKSALVSHDHHLFGLALASASVSRDRPLSACALGA